MFGCQTWNRTKINGIRIRCPTIRRSGNFPIISQQSWWYNVINYMKRVIIKVGTKVLSREDKTLDIDFFSSLVSQIVELKKKGVQVIVITSGAVGAGKSLINLPDAKSETVQKQIFASIGQVKLMSIYSELLARDNFFCAQVLVTKEDFRDETHYKNIQNCLEGLLVDNIIPIINENDVVATTELMFTDNDELAGFVASQLKADALMILTSTPGILDNAGKTVHAVDSVNSKIVSSYINSDKSTGGRGGMVSKFEVGNKLREIGIPVFVADGRRQNVIMELYEGKEVGTRFI